jgi:hypothetical protein
MLVSVTILIGFGVSVEEVTSKTTEAYLRLTYCVPTYISCEFEKAVSSVCPCCPMHGIGQVSQQLPDATSQTFELFELGRTHRSVTDNPQ